KVAVVLAGEVDRVRDVAGLARHLLGGAGDLVVDLLDRGRVGLEPRSGRDGYRHLCLLGGFGLDTTPPGLAKLWEAVHVYLTGELCFELDGNLVATSQFPGRQGRVAFAYLVLERERTVTRDELIGLLWPEEAPRSYEVALSALMSKLRQLLGRHSLETAARGYRLELPADAWVDIE